MLRFGSHYYSGRKRGTGRIQDGTDEGGRPVTKETIQEKRGRTS